MNEIKQDLTKKTAIYELTAVLGIIIYSIQSTSKFDFSTFSTGLGPWLIFPTVILSLEKVRNLIVWRDFLCFFVHFVSIGFFASITMPALSLFSVSILSSLLFSVLCLNEDDRASREANSPDEDERYEFTDHPERKYCYLIGILFFLWLICLAFSDNIFLVELGLVKLYRLSYIYLIFYALLSLRKRIKEWNNRRNTESDDAFTSSKEKSIFFAVSTAIAGISLGRLIDILLVDIGSK